MNINEFETIDALTRRAKVIEMSNFLGDNLTLSRKGEIVPKKFMWRVVWTVLKPLIRFALEQILEKLGEDHFKNLIK